MSDRNLLFAVDPSLTSTGWAVFTIDDQIPRAAGVLTPPGPSFVLAERLKLLQQDVESLFRDLELGAGDVLICEGPAPLVKNPLSSLKVERVRGIFETLARESGVSVPGRLNPRTVQSELLNLKGKQIPRKEVKEAARLVADRLFGNRLSSISFYGQLKNKKISQDIVDALLIGSLALSKIHAGLSAGQSILEVFNASSSFSNLHSKRVVNR